MSENTKTIIGWHFVADKLRDGSPIPEDGEWLRHQREIRLCAAGLHASRDPFDALRYASGATLCLVELRGDIIEAPGKDKLVARERRILARRDMSRELSTFAYQCARKTPGDERTVWDLLSDADLLPTWEVPWTAAEAEEWKAARAAARDAATEWHRQLFRGVVRTAFANVPASAAVLDELDETGSGFHS